MDSFVFPVGVCPFEASEAGNGWLATMSAKGSSGSSDKGTSRIGFLEAAAASVGIGARAVVEVREGTDVEFVDAEKVSWV